MDKKTNFTEITKSKKIWAIGSIHSRHSALESIKKYLLEKFDKNDSLVFLGNVIGLGTESKNTLSSILDLRNNLMSKFCLDPEKIIFLRGAQEEMFLKLLQLQTAPNPHDIVKWMYEHGVDATIKSYGFNIEELLEVSMQGTMPISKWTSRLNSALLAQPGHNQYFSNLKHAAYTDTKKILFLNRGVDISRPLSAQNDCFWWGYQNFSNLNKPYSTFIRIVRGYKSSNNEEIKDVNKRIVCSLFNQPLNSPKILAGIFNDSGKILDLFESH